MHFTSLRTRRFDTHRRLQQPARAALTTGPPWKRLDNCLTCSPLSTMINSDLVHILCASGLALIFTALLALIVQYNPKWHQGDRRAAISAGQLPMAIRWPENGRAWSKRSHLNYYGYSPVQRNVTGSYCPRYCADDPPPAIVHH